MNRSVDYGSLKSAHNPPPSIETSYQSTRFQLAHDEHNTSLDNEHPIRSTIFILSPIMLITSLIGFLSHAYTTAILLLLVALPASFVSQTRMLRATQSLELLASVAVVAELVEAMIFLTSNQTDNGSLKLRIISIALFCITLCSSHTLARYESLTDERALDILEAEQDLIEELRCCEELEEDRERISLQEHKHHSVIDVH